jgi:UDP-glucuronate decarboxylase
VKKILVTGGAGFLGSHLIEKLILADNEVYCLDNFYTGAERSIQHHLSNKRFKLLNQDVTDPVSLKVDEIYNLACPASPVHYQRNPVETIKTSVLGAVNMLELAEKTGARVLQASTSEVYGDPEVHPQTENYWGRVNPIGIRSCYDEGKRCAETLFFDFHRQFGTDIRVARIFNTYGPNMHSEDGRVVSNFIVQALQGKDISIYGDGSQSRSFCFVEDLIDGLISLMEAPNLTGPINLGNPNEFTILELAELIIGLTDSRSKVIFEPLPSDDPRQRKPDISLAKLELNWQPRVELLEGLRKTIKYFEEVL